jgi:predicted PolB exonuclease-like 3'-5' exonuclease
MLQLSGRDGFISLKNACAAFGIPSPKDGAIRADGVETAYYSGKIKEISEYCLRDVIATYKLYEIIINYISK